MLTDPECAKIRRAMTDPTHRLIWDIARWTGERWGAIVQLRVEDVYQDAKRVIPHDHITFRAQTRKATTKGVRVTRQVPIHPLLKELLVAYKPPADGYLFPSSRSNDGHLTLRACDFALRTAVCEANLVSKGICTHSTRVTFITNLHNLGVSPRTIQALTGHHDLKTLSHYIVISEEQAKQAITLL